jgi:imidazolonepropionase-like amidohydrolase
MIRSALIASALLLAAPAFAQTTAITGGKVVTNTSQGIIENGTVLIRDGRIVSVGTGAPPANAKVVDARGKWVTPGLFAAYSQVGMAELDSEDDTNDTAAGASDLQISLHAADGFNPASTAIPVNRIEGVTRLALVANARRGLFGGYGSLADTSGAFGSVERKDAFLLAEFGEAGADLGGGSRPAAWAHLLAAIDDAKAYPGRYSGEREGGDVLVRREAQALVPVVKGQVPLMIQAHRASDILQVITLKQREPKMKLIILGAAEGWRVADQIAAAKIPVIINPVTNLPDRFEILAATMSNAARLNAAGVNISIADPGEASHNSRWIPQLAGNAVANGLPWQAGFDAITKNPALLYGRTDLGVLQAGATADVVIWDGDPLELMASPDAVYIAGNSMPMTSRQTELRDRYMNAGTDGLPPAYRR